jgi:CRP/FNR family transcriptional regulator, cyclic AMP receptor protein
LAGQAPLTGQTEPPTGDRGEFLSLLGTTDRAALEERAGRRRFRRGALLMHEGQHGEEVLVLLSGRVKITGTTRDGREVVVRFAGPGEPLGELSVLDEQPRGSTVEAIEPVEALGLSAADFRALLERTGFATALLRTLARRFRGSDAARIEFAASQTLERVAARLLELVERYGEPAGDGSVVIALPLSQEELAGWTASSREAVAKALATLRALGLVVTERRRITVRDPEALRRHIG